MLGLLLGLASPATAGIIWKGDPSTPAITVVMGEVDTAGRSTLSAVSTQNGLALKGSLTVGTERGETEILITITTTRPFTAKDTKVNTGVFGSGSFNLINDKSKTAFVANFSVTESITDNTGGSADRTYWPKVSGGKPDDMFSGYTKAQAMLSQDPNKINLKTITVKDAPIRNGDWADVLSVAIDIKGLTPPAATGGSGIKVNFDPPGDYVAAAPEPATLMSSGIGLALLLGNGVLNRRRIGASAP
jgi:hypothetical protein